MPLPVPSITTGELWRMPWFCVWLSGRPWFAVCDTGDGVVGVFDMSGTKVSRGGAARRAERGSRGATA